MSKPEYIVISNLGLIKSFSNISLAMGFRFNNINYRLKEFWGRLFYVSEDVTDKEFLEIAPRFYHRELGDIKSGTRTNHIPTGKVSSS